MKRVLIFAVLVLSLGLSSCQCSEKPDVGPVEGQEAQVDETASSDIVRPV